MPPSAEAHAFQILSAKPRVVIFAERRDMHARALIGHFNRQGAEARRISLTGCSFDTSSRFGIALPGFLRRLPDAALVRSIPAGSFEAVTHRLGILHALRERGVIVWNDAQAIERCVDKSMTSFHLARAGIPTPPTWTAESPEAAAAIVRREGPRGPLVLKPLFGSQGRGLRLIRDPSDLPERDGVAGVYYLQRFMGRERPEGFHDFRVFVVAGRAIAAMTRHSPGWITNVKQGGRPRASSIDDELAGLAQRAAAAVGADFCGVDILRNGRDPAMVLEVNSMPAWAGLQKVAPVRISESITAALLAALESASLRRTA